MVLQEFDPVVALNKDILVRYFQKGLRHTIQAQLEEQSRKLDFWKEAIEKAVNIEAKAYYNHSQIPKKLTPSVSKGKDQQKKKQTLRKTSPLAYFLLTYPVGNNNLLSTRHPQPTQKKTKTTKKIFGADKSGDEDKTSWQ